MDRSPVLDAFQLKVIALLSMTADHLGACGLVPEALVPLCRTAGRMAAPLFLFLVTEGMRRTRSRSRYLLRLWLSGALISLAALALYRRGLIWDTGVNILPAFFYTGLLILVLEQVVSLRHAGRYAAALGWTAGLWAILSVLSLPWGGELRQALLPSPAGVMYSFTFVILGVCWYFLPRREHQILLLLFLSFAACIPGLGTALEGLLSPFFPFFSAGLLVPFQFPMVLAALPLWYYSGLPGRRGCKWFFYLYYPLHQFLFQYLALSMN